MFNFLKKREEPLTNNDSPDKTLGVAGMTIPTKDPQTILMENLQADEKRLKGELQFNLQLTPDQIGDINKQLWAVQDKIKNIKDGKVATGTVSATENNSWRGSLSGGSTGRPVAASGQDSANDKDIWRGQDTERRAA